MQERISKIINFIGSMSIFPKIFYSITLIVVCNIIAYSLILNTKALIFMLVLILNVFIKNRLNEYFFRFKSNSLDPMSYVMILSYVILNRNFDIFSPVTLWEKKYPKFSYNRYKDYLSCFSNILIHTFLFLLSIMLAISLGEFNLFSLKYVNFKTFNHLTILSQVVLSSIVINLNFVFMNLIPIAPFDMGIYLERLGLKIFRSINKLGSVIIFGLYYLGLIDVLSDEIYKIFLNYFCNYVR